MSTRVGPHVALVAALAAGGMATSSVLIGTVPAVAARTAKASVNARVVAGIGDVNTNLGYQNAAAAGTGMVLTGSGEVLTNNHVIRGATTIKVRDVGNKRTYVATVLGYDIGADVALLELKGASKLARVPIGNSASVKVGAPVTVIGNAGGKGGTPTSARGKVLALHQSITAADESTGTSEELVGLIETNAKVEPGDSGGPLVNARGAVVGVVTAGSSDFELQPGTGVGYAVPINKALAIVHKIEHHQFSAAIHPGATAFLGVDVIPSEYFGGSLVRAGVAVVGVVPGSPAQKAGLVAGDVITGLADKAVTSPTALSNGLLARLPGQKVQIAWVDQNGAAHQATAVLAAGPPQ